MESQITRELRGSVKSAFLDNFGRAGEELFFVGWGGWGYEIKRASRLRLRGWGITSSLMMANGDLKFFKAVIS